MTYLLQNLQNQNSLMADLLQNVKITGSFNTHLILHFHYYLLVRILAVGSCHHYHFPVFYFYDGDGALS